MIGLAVVTLVSVYLAAETYRADIGGEALVKGDLSCS
jgi:hypothetical protein